MNDPVGSDKSDSVLRLEKVSLTFRRGQRRVKALDGASLRVRRGLVTGLVGPDGAGKTTLMRLAAGLLVPDEGEVETAGYDVSRHPRKVQASIGYMPQRFGLYEDLTVRENLDLYADLQGLPKDLRRDRYRELTRMTGLGPFSRRLAGRLSGGMKQKLGLACTLVRSPELLLLDEPTVGVDPVSRRELWAIVYRLVKEESMSVLLSTAYLDEAERCQEVIVLHEGKVLGDGPPEHFTSDLRGRTYSVTVPGVKKRRIQKRLAGAAGVLDAVIHGDGVRLVAKDSSPPDVRALLKGVEDVDVRAVPPRFEDGFVALLKKGGEPPQTPDGPSVVVGARKKRTDNGPVIEVKDVKRRFGDFYAVKGVTFQVNRGEVFGLLGANGAGKSTTFRMLCGLLPPSEGTLTVAGADLRKASAKARARIGYMSQKFSLYGNLSVLQNLSFFGGVYGLGGRDRASKVEWALDRFHLASVKDTVSGDLPLGYKQRLAMACALMHEPEILFLDEPTSGVDPLARREFWGRINELAEGGGTVMVTTHFMEEAEYCDRLAILSAGEILALGTPREIKASQSSPENPRPDMEQTFVRLMEQDDSPKRED